MVVGQAFGTPERDARWHLVLTTVAAPADADVIVDNSAALTQTWNSRLRVYAHNLTAGRRGVSKPSFLTPIRHGPPQPGGSPRA